jgi:hypothetical protein
MGAFREPEIQGGCNGRLNLALVEHAPGIVNGRFSRDEPFPGLSGGVEFRHQRLNLLANLGLCHITHCGLPLFIETKAVFPPPVCGNHPFPHAGSG